MVIDAAKGIEARTRKLFEVCRLRDIPILTFINKLDRETRDPFDLLDEIEKTLALDVAPMTWPLGRGRAFAGTFDLQRNLVRRLDRDSEPVTVGGPSDKFIASLLNDDDFAKAHDEIDLARGGFKGFRSHVVFARPYDACLFWQRVAQFRGARFDRRAQSLRAAAARPASRLAHRRCEGSKNDRLCV